MRFSGRLQDWNEQRGFGFIRPDGGGDDVFVHVSALPAPRPSHDEVLTFEVAVDAQGRKKAVQVRRQAVEAAALQGDRARDAQRTPMRHGRGRESRGAPGVLARGFATLVVVVLLAGFGYRAYLAASPRPEHAGIGEDSPPSRQAAPVGALAGSGTFSCDGRKYCGQMRSCEEATFFLRNCPGTEMDGDGDGVPCEQQWCTWGAR